MITCIGTNARLIWNALDKLGKMNVKQLKKTTKIHTEKDVYTTLGWLVEEKEPTFVYEDGVLLVSLR